MGLKVSLILTTYNSKDNLPKTLESIEKQDYDNVEVVIKDGLSLDGTLEIIDNYVSSSKYKVLKLSCKDTGIYDAMNQGIDVATGDIIVCFNDKFINSNVISQMVKLIENGDENVVGAHADLVYSNEDKVIRYWRMGKQKPLITGWMPGHPTLFLKREVYEKYGVYKIDYKIAADYEFMVRFLSDKEGIDGKGPNKLAYLPETIISMFYGGTSTSTKSSYISSLKEGHRALKENGVVFAFIADILRTLRVLLQFVAGSK